MKQISVRIRPISIRWASRWDRSDKLFYIGKSWEASLCTLAGEYRCELESTRIQIGPIRIMLCSFDLPEHDAPRVQMREEKSMSQQYQEFLGKLQKVHELRRRLESALQTIKAVKADLLVGGIPVENTIATLEWEQAEIQRVLI